MARHQSKQKGTESEARRIAALKRRTRNRIVLWVGVTVAVIGLATVFFATVEPPAQAAVVEGRASLGEPAPVIEMVDFDGEKVTLAQFVGTPIVLNFWSSWCPFCIAEMPDFERVSQAAGGRVEFIGVNLQDDQGLANQLRKETGITYRVTRDPRGVVYDAFGGIGMPTTVFIDADGRVREVVTGQMSEEQLRAKIAEHFAIEV
ncbi:thiol-disulfide oxidoreductase ResA [bacterium BMS3Bbin02]|nr:thiol-disulfide oxidoreductase ResA [bacterium BMS3Bbin02]